MLSANAKLTEFTSNPFFSYFTTLLQHSADEGMASIVGGFTVRDRIAILEREQTIGAAPAYLKFSQLVEEFKTDLLAEIKLNEQ